jgi:UDP-glucose 4-epimerase
MKILFTGASSFTGFWFVRTLAQAGHDVTATFRRRPEEYADALRRKRAELLTRECRPVYGCSFGDEQFLKLAAEMDLLCHHAADVTNYKSPDFNVTAAVENNTRNLRAACDTLRQRGGKIVLTGSIFESGEGAGTQGLRAFSPYGLSKSLTWSMFEYFADEANVPLGKFVIPNPFGPFEEPRFTAYLMKCWYAEQAAVVNTPAYVRDNIHVSLLALAYRRFVESRAASNSKTMRLNPSGYTETQGAFTQRVATEMRARLGLACEVRLNKQVDFPEPRVRVNTDPLETQELHWDEAAAWDEMAEYYRQPAKA